MKIEDMVKVIKLEIEDQETNLSIGDTGIVKNINDTGDVVDVDFGDMFHASHFNKNINPDGTYQMWEDQLQVLESNKPKTTARVIVTYACNRSCPGCCNTHENSVRKIEDINELLKYDEVVITGGDPMLIKEKLIHFILRLRRIGFKGKIFMYTALWYPGIYSNEILQFLDGITFTIHAEADETDVIMWKRLSENLRLVKNSRLFIDERVWDKFVNPDARRIHLWDEVRKLEWKDECKPAEHEELVEFLL